MAESTLSVNYDDFLRVVGRQVGIGEDSTLWTTAERTRVDDVIADALRLFYYPPPLPTERMAHEWSFLRGDGLLVAWATVTATATIVGYDSLTGLTTINGSPSFTSYPTMLGKQVVFSASGNTYVIGEAPTGLPQIKVTGDASGEANGDTFTIVADGNYDLPDDFGVIDGQRMTFAPNQTYRAPIRVTSVQEIEVFRQRATGDRIPQLAAFRYKTSDASTGQRSEVMLYPVPDTLYNIGYRYAVLPNKLDANNKYPLGGSAHGQTILEACRAQAELEYDDGPGARFQTFMAKLAVSVDQDRRRESPYLGQNTDDSDELFSGTGRTRRDDVIVTYNGLYST